MTDITPFDKIGNDLGKPESHPKEVKPCTCCNDLAQAAAAFADSTRANNYEEAERHRARYCEILIKHVTDDKPLTPASAAPDKEAKLESYEDYKRNCYCESPTPTGYYVKCANCKDADKIAIRDYAAKCAENEKLKQALEKLTKEVCGILGYAEIELREALGNTNVSVLKEKAQIAREALEENKQ